ncbi:DHBP synthase RibB-like alpha/beta domain-containing protein [Prunus dulcis]|nr:DHBP synthase RibB-like alpha/beta domain-containing protein [Prunus dulcis]
MNIPARVAATLPLLASPLLPFSSLSLQSFCSLISHHRVRKLGLVPTVQGRRLRLCVEEKMAWSLEKCDAGVETELG